MAPFLQQDIHLSLIAKQRIKELESLVDKVIIGLRRRPRKSSPTVCRLMRAEPFLCLRARQTLITL